MRGLILLLCAVLMCPATRTQQKGDIFKQHRDLMYIALVEGNADRVNKLLKTPYIEVNDEIQGQTLLQLAIQYQHEDVIDVLLKNGADITAGDPSNILNSWSLRPRLPMLQFLMVRVKKHFGDDTKGLIKFVNNSGSYGRNPLCAAMVYTTNMQMIPDEEALEVVKILVAAGARVNDADDGGYAPLDYAKCYRTQGNTYEVPQTVAFLVKNGAVCAKKSNH